MWFIMFSQISDTMIMNKVWLKCLFKTTWLYLEKWRKLEALQMRSGLRDQQCCVFKCYLHTFETICKESKRNGCDGWSNNDRSVFLIYFLPLIALRRRKAMLEVWYISNTLNLFYTFIMSLCFVVVVICTIHALDSQFSRVARGLLSPGTWVTWVFYGLCFRLNPELHSPISVRNRNFPARCLILLI